ncbi:TCP-1/cpn60 chaperonin family protein [Halarchaeum nitratireducens]|uniref:TCP-1/cpn60 chaperonin family protein n=1 Tax=Halarchaeum nitratireducens TaxID=489913 RepID=UPI001666D4C9|nr:TCP-1/cpn60 chaperonin family protein [Halarchaeum nitratireducens]
MSHQGTRSPVFILGDDARRTRGRDAQTANIAAGKAVADAVRTTLGPRGMDKMLVDSTGTVVITNDGVTILAEMDIEHPTAQMLVEDADLGYAESVRVERYGEDDLALVEGGADASTVTLLVRGSTEHVLDELERAIGDALDVVAVALDDGVVVPGAGYVEIVVADRIRDEAARIDGRAQLAAEAFADALDVLPRTLAENTGMDPIDALVDLRAENETGRAGVVTVGDRGEIGDPVAHGVLDPAAVKHEALAAATEAATMIVRIDDVIAAE